MNLPQSVKNTLWSYNTNQIDLQKDKDTIIFGILNLGTLESVQWLQKTYSQKEILETITKSNTNNWSAKSLNYWSSYFSVLPKSKNRFV